MDQTGIEPGVMKSLPSKEYFVIEHPGHVVNIEKALETLGGIDNICQKFKERDGNWELRFRKDPLSHPINGKPELVRHVLLKVKRKIRRYKSKNENVYDHEEEILSTTAEIMGIVKESIKFRGMADYQMINRSEQVNKLNLLKKALQEQDLNGIWNIPLMLCNMKPSQEIIPPPVFSHIEVPFNYNYEQESSILKLEAVNEGEQSLSDDGNYKLVNRSSRDFYAISVTKRDFRVPTEPPEEALKAKEKIDPILIKKAEEIFESRPIWTRNAFSAEFMDDRKPILNIVLPLYAYYVTSGPFRDCWIRYGYDPRKTKDSRIYQILDLRNKHIPRFIFKPKSKREKDSTPQTYIKEGKNNLDSVEKDYILNVQKNEFPKLRVYTICDIIYPRLNQYINNEATLLKEYNQDTGWFHREIINRMVRMVFKKCYGKPFRNEILHIDLEELEDVDETEKEKIVTFGKSWFAANKRIRQLDIPSTDEEREDTDAEELIRRYELRYPTKGPSIKTEKGDIDDFMQFDGSSSDKDMNEETFNQSEDALDLDVQQRVDELFSNLKMQEELGLEDDDDQLDIFDMDQAFQLINADLEQFSLLEDHKKTE